VPVLAVADTLLAVATSPLPLPFLAFGFGVETEGPAETTPAESMGAEATHESSMANEAVVVKPVLGCR